MSVGNRAISFLCSIVDGPYEFGGVDELLQILEMHGLLASMHTSNTLRISLLGFDPMEALLLGMALEPIKDGIEHVSGEQIVIRLKESFLYPSLRIDKGFERH